MIKKQNKILLLMTGPSCNNNCRFCSVKLLKKDIDRTKEDLVKILFKNKKKYDEVEFIGGEFSIRKDAIYLVEIAKKLGYKNIIIETNGRMFKNLDFAKKIVKAGLSTISFSIHASKAKTHDELTLAPNSFNEAMIGLKNINNLGVKVDINYVITKTNYKEIYSFTKIIRKISTKIPITFSLVRPVEHFNKKVFFELMPKFSEILPYINKVINMERIKVRSFPPCLLPEKKIINHKEKINIDKDYINEDMDIYNSIRSVMTFSKKCKKCKLKPYCEGIWKKYLKYYGDKELKPKY